MEHPKLENMEGFIRGELGALIPNILGEFPPLGVQEFPLQETSRAPIRVPRGGGEILVIFPHLRIFPGTRDEVKIRLDSLVFPLFLREFFPFFLGASGRNLAPVRERGPPPSRSYERERRFEEENRGKHGRERGGEKEKSRDRDRDRNRPEERKPRDLKEKEKKIEEIVPKKEEKKVYTFSQPKR